MPRKASWTKIQRGTLPKNFPKSRPSISADNAASKVPLSGANKVPLAPPHVRRSAFDHLIFLDEPVQQSDKGKNPIGQVHQDGAGPPNLDLAWQPVSGQYHDAGDPSAALAPGICSRCLTKGHARELCKSPVRCFVCHCWDHIAVNCRSRGT